jgi:hypothetical protein
MSEPKAIIYHFHVEENLPPELQKELYDMSFFSDKALWEAAKTAFPVKYQRQVRDINYKQQKEGEDSLTQAEIALKEELLNQSARYMLLRAQAAVLLKERGHDISSLGPKKRSDD